MSSKQSVGDVWIVQLERKRFHQRGTATAKFRRCNCCIAILMLTLTSTMHASIFVTA